MQVKASRVSKGTPPSVLSQLLPNNWLRLLFVLALAGALFFSGSVFGAYMLRTSQLSLGKSMVKGLLREKLAVIPNYLRGLTADPLVVYIDVKSNDYQKLAYFRDEALSAPGIFIPQELVDELIPAKVSTGASSERAKAKLSIHGHRKDHIAQPLKWSLSVNLGGDSLVGDMNRFALLIPQARSHPPFTEWLTHKLLTSVDLISLQYEFVDVVLNGKNRGIFVMEEHFDKRMLARNGRDEGIIFRQKPNHAIKLYRSKSIAAIPRLSHQASQLNTLWAAFWAGDIKTSALFNVDKLGSYYALTDLVNGQHSFYLGNEFYYLDVNTQLVEPIGREWDSPFTKEPNTFALFAEYPFHSNDVPLDAETRLFHGNVFRDSAFVRSYFIHLRKYASADFLNAFLSTQQQAIAKTEDILYSEWAYTNTSTNYLFDKIDYITDYLDSDFSTGLRAYRASAGSDSSVEIFNNHHFPIICTSMRVDKDFFNIDSELAAKEKTTVVLPADVMVDGDHSTYLGCSVPGIDKIFEVKVFPWSKDEAAKKAVFSEPPA
jgi:hypothetical protein